MNLFSQYQNKIMIFLKDLKEKKVLNFPEDIKGLTVEPPPKNQTADISCNAAMILSKYNDIQIQKIALILQETLIKSFPEFKKVEISKQGFLNINFTISFWENCLREILKLKKNFGSNKLKKKKYNLEFVSANPTGPLHVGHCRGAILGDSLTNLLIFNGNEVTKEYYVNDYGTQIKNFVNSVYFRILEILKKETFPTSPNLYPGDYIIDIAKKIIESKKIKDFSNFQNIFKELSEESLIISMNIIKENLRILGISHDLFVYESKLIKDDLVSKTVDKLKYEKLVYEGKLKQPKGDVDKNWESRKQLLFNSTKFGDDTDRALQKADLTWTYFASDIAYHQHKVNRNFDILINILGADHAGYIKRITAATNALSGGKNNLICKVSQLVKLYKKGKPFKMSKRKGDYITVDDLIKEVGKDAVRFMMLSRSNDVELDFDFEKVTEKSKDNPVYYVQYAYARICSVFRNINLKIDENIKIEKNFHLNSHEIQILKKISEWSKCVEVSSLKLEPHRITFYLYELSSLFHSYWNLGKDNKELRFISENKDFNKSRLLILQAIAIVIQNAMSILGVSTPNKM
jgi:arginyl-tRNA synthetase